jgi:hypothetical protein
MRSSTEKLVRAIAVAVLAAAVVSPAAAQFGGLKKKVKAAAGAEEKPAPPAQAGGGDGGGTLVLDDDVVNRFLLGFKAAQAEREVATKENTPYGKYLQAQIAAEAAARKCSGAQATFPQRMTADEKLRVRYTAMADKMMAAMEKQDMKRYQAYADSAMLVMEPACLVKPPQRPENWDELQRQVDQRAEQKSSQVSGLDARELGFVTERVFFILRDPTLPDASASEKSAVKKREAELKRAMGMEEVPAARAQKAAPSPAVADPAPAGPQLTPDQRAMNDCMAKNAQKHEKEYERLGKLASAAAESGNTQAAMVYADSIQQLNMQDCLGR